MSALARVISALSRIASKNGHDSVQAAERIEPSLAMGGRVRLERGTEAEPAGQVEPRLRPGEAPTGWPAASSSDGGGSGTGAAAGPGAPAPPVDGPGPPGASRAGARTARRSGSRRGRRPGSPGPPRRGRGRRASEVDASSSIDRGACHAGLGNALVVLGRRREQDRRRQLLELAQRDRRVGVVGGDHLALLGQLEAAVDRARGLGEDRPVRRSATPADRAAAAVEQGQLESVPAGRLDQRCLRPVEQPVRRQEARLLVRVGVAEHHLLAIAPSARGGAR